MSYKNQWVKDMYNEQFSIIENDGPGCTAPDFYEMDIYTSNFQIPDFTIVKTVDGMIKIIFDKESQDSTIRGTIMEEEIIDPVSLAYSNFIHDYTFQPLFGKKTDMLLSSFFPRGFIQTNLQPDLVLCEGNFRLILEFTTVKSGLERSTTEKLDKYYPIAKSLCDEANEKIHTNTGKITGQVLIIAISDYKIRTNFLSPELMDKYKLHMELAMRLRVARKVDEFLLQKNYKDRVSTSPGVSMTKKLFLNSIKALLAESTPDFKIEKGSKWDLETIYKVIEKAENSQDPCFEVINKTKTEILSSLGKNKPASPEYRSSTEYKKDKLKEFKDEEKRFLKEYHERHEQNIRENMKAICQFPLLIPNRRMTRNLDISVEANFIDLYQGDELVPRMFKEAVGFARENPQNFSLNDDPDNAQSLNEYFEQGAMDDDVEGFSESLDYMTFGSEKNASGIRNKNMRVKIRGLDFGDKLELAFLGVEAKMLRERNEVLNHGLEKKKVFPLEESMSSDLEAFMKSPKLLELFDRHDDGSCLTTNQIINLVNKARAFHGEGKITPKLEESVNEIINSRIFSWCKFISDVATELCISLRQSCSKGFYVLKKLKDYNVWLLIKPTTSGGPIFYSMLGSMDSVLILDESTVFRRINRDNDFWWTDFLSMNMSKLQNLSLMESRIIPLIEFWNSFHKIEPFQNEDPNNRESGINSKRMCMLSVLIMMADKAEVEEEITRTRYMVMESLTSWPLEPKMEKMISKGPKGVRNRLTCWLFFKHQSYCRALIEKPARLVTNEELDTGSVSSSFRQWKGFRNPYLNSDLLDPQQVINLFYLGYFKNKDEYPENNALSKLYEKILEIEDKYTDEIHNRLGITDKVIGSGTYHEYNVTILVKATKNVIKQKESENSQWRDEVMEDFYRYMCETSVNDVFTTLKATSNFSPVLYDYSKLRESKYHRSKVIEKIQNYTEGDNTMIYQSIRPAYNESVIKNGCLHIDIFQKNQHGGLREIYVLSLADRILQFVVEYLSRLFCLKFEGETMTHPSNKSHLPANQASLVQKYHKKGTFMYAQSADASKWSQNHHAQKFLVMLILITPKEMHEFLCHILHLWEKKRILINPLLLKMFEEDDDRKFYSDIVTNMYSGFKGTNQGVKWASKDQPYIETRSGMMQGILHYTSSLFHTIINEHCKSLCHGFVKKWSESNTKTGAIFKEMIHRKILVTVMQSSDDSCMIINIPDTGSSKCRPLSAILAVIFQKIKTNIGEEMSIKNSVKTTDNTPFCYEFNSNFEFNSSHYKPDIKHLIAGNLISEQEQLSKRQEELGNLLTSYIESGGVTHVANYMQVGQALLHYRLMGSSMTHYFSTYSSLISLLPDPANGFFLMDNPLLTGLSGWKYNLWNACMETTLGDLYCGYMENITNPDVDQEFRKTIELTTSGTFSQNVRLAYGNRQKWGRLIESMDVPQNWRDILNSQPDLLYRSPINQHELATLIAKKISSPDVAQSLSKGNAVTRVIASSAYILKFKSLSRLSKWFFIPSSEEKFSLLQAVMADLKNITKDRKRDDLIRLLFPFHDDYHDLKVIADNIKPNAFNKTYKEFRRKATNVMLYIKGEYAICPPEIYLPHLWWGRANHTIKSPGVSPATVALLFEAFKRKVPWISLDPEETLMASPFQDHLELKSWMDSISHKERIVRLMGTSAVSRAGQSTIKAAIYQNYSNSHHMVDLEPEIRVKTGDTTREVKHALLMATRLSSGFPVDRLDVCKHAISSLVTRPNTQTTSRRSKIIGFLNSWLQYKATKTIDADMDTRLSDDLAQLRIGVLGYYTTRQSIMSNRGDKYYYGHGVWRGSIDGRPLELKLYGEKNKPESNHVTEIVVNSIAHLDVIKYPLRNLIREMGAKWDPSTRYRVGGQYYNDRLNAQIGSLVTVNPDLRFNEILNLHSAELEMTDYNIKLVHNKMELLGPKKTRYISTPKVTLISYTPRDSDIMGVTPVPEDVFNWTKYVDDFNSREPSVKLKDMEPFFVHWMNNSPADWEDALEIADNALTLAGTNKALDFVGIIQSMIRRICGEMGVVKADKDIKISDRPIPAEEEEDLMRMYNEIDFSIELDDDDFLKELDNVMIDSFDLATEIDELQEEYSALFRLPSSDVQHNRSNAAFRHHKLLNNLFYPLRKHATKESMTEMFIGMRVPNRLAGYRSVIALYHGIVNENDIQIEPEIQVIAGKGRNKFVFTD